jgi:hypothetical protein
MITQIEDTGGIKSIRVNSHRYLAKKTGNDEVTICQLNDYNSNYYADGEKANLTGTEGDVFMRLPKFYYRAIEVVSGVWEITFAHGGAPDASFKEWDGNDLIGVYKSYCQNSKVYSRSGVVATGSTNYNNYKSFSRNRGAGYSLVKWKHHSMMAFLFYALYKNTNSQKIIGTGASSISATGTSNNIGMSDGGTTAINFWGLEAWWGWKHEFVDNIVTYGMGQCDIIEDDGSARRITSLTIQTGYIERLSIGEHLDAIPTMKGGGENCSYCDYYFSGVENCASTRGGNNVYGETGICAFNTSVGKTYSDSTYSSRLAFRGNIIEEKDSSVFKNITALG